MRPRFVILTVLAAAVIPALAERPAELSPTDILALETLIRGSHGEAVTDVKVLGADFLSLAYSDTEKRARVTIGTQETGTDFALSRVADCRREDGRWTCEQPVRLVAFPQECPETRVILGATITVGMARTAMAKMKSELGDEYLTVNGVSIADDTKYVQVDYTFRRGGGARWFPREEFGLGK